MTVAKTFDRNFFSGKFFNQDRNLTRDEEAALIRAFREDGDKEAGEALLVCHSGHLAALVTRVLKKIGMPMSGPLRDEAQQIAFAAFMEALEGVDISKGRLATYCASHVYYDVLRKMSETRQPFRMLTSLNEKRAHAAVRAVKHNASRRGTDIGAADIPEIARIACVSERHATRVIERHMNMGNDIAIDATPEVLDVAVPENLIDRGSYDDIDTMVDARRVMALADRLDPRARDIFLRAASGDEDLDAIALSHNISKERVRQINRDAIAQIRSMIAKKPAAGAMPSIGRNRTTFTSRLLTIGGKPAGRTRPTQDRGKAHSLTALIETALREAQAQGNAEDLLKEFEGALTGTAIALGLPAPAFAASCT